MRLLLVPPDTRPPTLALPKRLAEAAGMQVRVPPVRALPQRNLPGDRRALRAWLTAEAPEAQALIVSLETLALGGMIPARRVRDPLDEALAFLEVLSELKARYRALRILAGGVIVRVAHDDDPLEEKPYYGTFGAALRRFSERFDRHARSGSAPDAAALEDARAALPQAVLADWLDTRRRNHALHLAALELARAGVLEHFCVTLDDTAPYGLAAFDRRALEEKVDALGLWDRVDIYPGADEVPLTLLARLAQTEPCRVFVLFSSVLGAGAELRYEDRPAGELVRAQLRAAACVEATRAEDADLVLAVNTPGHKQGLVQPDFVTVDTAARQLPWFVDELERLLARGRALSLADIAYANGAEARLMTLLAARLPLAALAGFSAWNTAGNTLGSAVAMGVLSRHLSDRAAWHEVLFGRLVDDWLYQGRVRAEVDAALGAPSPFDLGDAQAEAERLIEARLRPLAEGLWQAHFAGAGRLRWHGATLAWPRLFTGVFAFGVEGEP